MTATVRLPHASSRDPRLGGLLMRVARKTTRLALPFAGRRWNPLFSVVRHTGRRSGRTFETPVAARRVRDGFVVTLAFGPTAHWYRNLLAARGGVIRWREVDWKVGAPETMSAEAAIPEFRAIQRAGLRAAGIDGFLFLPDARA